MSIILKGKKKLNGTDMKTRDIEGSEATIGSIKRKFSRNKVEITKGKLYHLFSNDSYSGSVLGIDTYTLKGSVLSYEVLEYEDEDKVRPMVMKITLNDSGKRKYMKHQNK